MSSSQSDYEVDQDSQESNVKKSKKVNKKPSTQTAKPSKKGQPQLMSEQLNLITKKVNSEVSEEEDEDDDEEESVESKDSSIEDEQDDDANAFKMKPPDPKDYNEDGSRKYQLKTKLMLKLETTDPYQDQDDHDNSFEDCGSDEESESSSEDDEDEEGSVEEEEQEPEEKKEEEESQEEEDPDSPESPDRRKNKKSLEKENLKTEEENQDSESSQDKPVKKYRKNVMNVHCTEYGVVKRVARRMLGFRLKEYEEDHEGSVVNGEGNQKLKEDWDVSWHDLGITADFLSKMQTFQKVNQYPGMYVITRKNYLARNLMKMQRAFPNEYKFFPKTWLIPQENSDFRSQFVDSVGKPLTKKRTYIVKPEGLSQGQGIYLSRNCEKIIENCTADGGYIVQEYLDKPHLIDDLKYDLRIYVLLYGINPMRVFIHEQGIARFATEPYVQPKANNLNNLFMHLTNYAINKNNAAFCQNLGGKGKGMGDDDEESEDPDTGDSEEESGHKRSLNAILKILLQQGGDPDKILDEIKDIVVKTIIVGQPFMSHIYRSCQPDDYDNAMCFQILGFDIMIDKNFKPWLIEVNQSPSFKTDSPLDYEVKKQVLRDAFKLLNISQPKRQKLIKIKKKQMAQRILTGKQEKVDPEMRKKNREQRLGERFDFERQQLRCGSGNNYEIIFPSLYEEEKNQQYEVFIKKANDIWDEFTTGAKGKKREEQKIAEKEKAEMLRKKEKKAKDDALKKKNKGLDKDKIEFEKKSKDKNKNLVKEKQITITQNSVTTTSQHETLQIRGNHDQSSRQVAKNSTSLLNLPSFDTTKQTTSDSTRRIKLNHMVQLSSQSINVMSQTQQTPTQNMVNQSIQQQNSPQAANRSKQASQTRHKNYFIKATTSQSNENKNNSIVGNEKKTIYPSSSNVTQTHPHNQTENEFKYNRNQLPKVTIEKTSSSAFDRNEKNENMVRLIKKTSIQQQQQNQIERYQQIQGSSSRGVSLTLNHHKNLNADNMFLDDSNSDSNYKKIQQRKRDSQDAGTAHKSYDQVKKDILNQSDTPMTQFSRTKQVSRQNINQNTILIHQQKSKKMNQQYQMDMVPQSSVPATFQRNQPLYIYQNKMDNNSKNRIRSMYEQIILDQFGNNQALERQHQQQQPRIVSSDQQQSNTKFFKSQPQQQVNSRRFQNGQIDSQMQYPANLQRIGISNKHQQPMTVMNQHSQLKSQPQSINNSHLPQNLFFNYEKMNSQSKGIPIQNKKILNTGNYMHKTPQHETNKFPGLINQMNSHNTDGPNKRIIGTLQNGAQTILNSNQVMFAQIDPSNQNPGKVTLNLNHNNLNHNIEMNTVSPMKYGPSNSSYQNRGQQLARVVSSIPKNKQQVQPSQYKI